MKSTVQIANEILTHLVVRSSSAWSGAIYDVVVDRDDAAKFVATLARKFNTDHARTYSKSMADLAGELPAIEKDDFKAAIVLLKDANKIVQCGKGKGVAIVILDSEHLPEADGWIRPDDFSALLKAISSYGPEMERLRAEVTRLTAENEEILEVNASLSQQLQLKHLTTWS